MGCRNKEKIIVIVESLVMMIVFQGLRELAEYIVGPWFPDTQYTKKMITMSTMIVLSLAVITYAKIKKQKLSIFPEKFSKWYVIATCTAVILYITAPANYIEGLPAVMMLIYGSIVTPVYEELLFRGYIWNRYNMVMSEEKYTYAWNVFLFAVWHLGYMIPQVILCNWNAVIWKLIAGFGYGVVLGFVRLKTKNCWATILTHGILNLFIV